MIGSEGDIAARKSFSKELGKERNFRKCVVLVVWFWVVDSRVNWELGNGRFEWQSIE
jgi:hypothetical protein